MAEYPVGLPVQSVGRVEAAITSAERSFAESRRDFQAVIAFVVEVVETFLTELRTLSAQPGGPSARELRPASNRFIDELIDESYRDKFNRVVGRRSSLLASDISYFDFHAPGDRHEFGTRVRAEIYDLPAWVAFLDALQERLNAPGQLGDSSTDPIPRLGPDRRHTDLGIFKRQRNGTWTIDYDGRLNEGPATGSDDGTTRVQRFEMKPSTPFGSLT